MKLGFIGAGFVARFQAGAIANLHDVTMSSPSTGRTKPPASGPPHLAGDERRISPRNSRRELNCRAPGWRRDLDRVEQGPRREVRPDYCDDERAVPAEAPRH